MSDQTPLPEDDDLLAAELAFGLLGADERAGAEARMRSESEFAKAHERWVARSVDLLNARDEPPPPSLWRRLESRLDMGAAPVPPPAIRTLRWWRMATAAASATAMLLAAILLVRTPPTPATQSQERAVRQFVAILTSDDRAAVLTISFDQAGNRLLCAPSRLTIGRKAAELWVIPADKRPRSLGVIDAATPSRRSPPAAFAPLLTNGATLAVSLEPAGGSPTGAPTGAVILTGKISPI